VTHAVTPALTHAWRSLRVQLAVVGFLAIYVPVLLLFGVTRVSEDEVVEERDGVEVTGTTTTDTSTRRSSWATWTVVALGPAAGALAWWWAGRAVRPIDRVRAVAEDIEATDLGRRIGLDHGPAEVRSLASSFDAMLDRLQQAADTQRRLVEETSHELRTPLSVLAVNADVLLADPDPTLESYRQGLERSKAAAARLEATIDDLLVDARGRARTLDRRPADLVAIARGAADNAQVLAAAREVTVAVTGPPTAICSVDEPTVRRAVANLVDNAVRYAPPGSGVEVEVDPTGTGTSPGTEAAVIVTDHGPGIPHDQQDHVFERFWRGRPDTPGTGLGLPIARQIALAHGGDLTVESPGPTGDGCAFTFTVRCGASP
jgi:signal transduction histidine kinase